MERTKEQLSAINSRGKNVLVSASAGSGKTSVMIERIVNIILNKEAGIDEILATTFTKLAAEEMKQRLLKALKQSGSKKHKKLTVCGYFHDTFFLRKFNKEIFLFIRRRGGF